MKAAHILLTVIVASFTNICAASDDAYLKALEAEAQNLHSAEQQSGKSAANEPSKNTDPDKTVETQNNIRKSDFETVLKKQLPNTYTIYTRLTPEQKMMVVELYFANDKNMAVASKQVFDFYLFDRKRATQKN